MFYRQILNYYYECLKLESYYSIYFKQKELSTAIIDVSNTSSITQQYQKLHYRLKEEHLVMFGYPLLRKMQGNQVVYLPLFLWSNRSFPDDHFLQKADQVGFHQEIYKSITDKKHLNKLEGMQKQFAANPHSFIKNEQNLDDLLNFTEYSKEDISYEYIMFQTQQVNTGSIYHIMKEIKELAEDKHKPTHVTQSFLNHSFAITDSNHDNDSLFHIVSSNLPQNTAILNINNTINLLKGPPGTGKTQTILNLIANQIARDQTCIIASTNNQAVINVAEKLEGKGIKNFFFGFVRLGSKDINRLEAPKIQSLLEQMQLAKNELSNNAYLELLNQSKSIYSRIKQAEELEQQIIEAETTIQKLKELLHILNDRLILQHVAFLKEKFEALDLKGEKLELRLRELLDQPSQLYGTDIFRKFRAFLGGKITSYSHNRIKKYMKSMNAANLWEHIDVTSPLPSIAICEEVIKIINLEHRLETYLLKLDELQEQSKNSKENSQTLYQEKIKLDLQIIRYKWLQKAAPILNSRTEMNRIAALIKELSIDGKLDTSGPDFQSFTALFPVILISSLSVRNCVPYSMLFDLSIIDESSQCSVPSVISLLQSSRKACFFGDINQLSHIVSLESKDSDQLFTSLVPGIESQSYCFRNVSAFERAEHASQLSENGVYLLSYHYRCIPSIIQFSNQHFYGSRLRIIRKEPERLPFYSGIYSTNVYAAVSGTINYKEIKEIEMIVENLENKGVHQIGIVTPFNAQKNKLRAAFKDKKNIRIGTVHTFQGGESRAIIFSSVISDKSTSFQVDFVQNSFRMINVALTRALDYFILVGNLAKIDNGNGYLTKLSHYIHTIEAKSFYRQSIELSIEFNRILHHENRKSLMHKGERMTFNKLQLYLESMPFVVYPKVPVKDVLSINLKLDKPLRDLYFTGHMDFVIYEKETLLPLFAVEYDGKYHREDKKTIDNDIHKDQLCKYAEFKLIRISSHEEGPGWEELKKYLHDF